MKHCAVCYLERCLTIMAVPASYTPYTVLFLTNHVLYATMGTNRRSTPTYASRCSMQLSWSGNRSMTSIRFMKNSFGCQRSCFNSVLFAKIAVVCEKQLRFLQNGAVAAVPFNYQYYSLFRVHSTFS